MSLVTNALLLLCVIMMRSSCMQDNEGKAECKALTFCYTINVPGCEPKVVRNSFCYGQCKSYFVPNGKFYSKPGFTCSSCRPVAVKRLTHYLKCHTSKGKQCRPWKAVRILGCACMKTLCTPWLKTELSADSNI